jgi:hypothetical protein
VVRIDAERSLPLCIFLLRQLLIEPAVFFLAQSEAANAMAASLEVIAEHAIAAILAVLKIPTMVETL